MEDGEQFEPNVDEMEGGGDEGDMFVQDGGGVFLDVMEAKHKILEMINSARAEAGCACPCLIGARQHSLLIL